MSRSDAVPPFLSRSTSAVAAEMMDHDWSATTLGPIESWPVSMRAMLATLLACPTPMYLAWGPDLLSFYNDAYRPILGYRAASALGTPFRELWASIWDEIAPLVDDALAGRNTMVTDMQLDLNYRKDGTTFWNELYLCPVFDEAGAVAGLLCVTGETTPRLLAERARETADERLQMALSAGDSIGTWDWDVLNDWVRADARFATLYGVDPDRAAKGAPIAEFFGGIHPDDLARVRGEIELAMREGDRFASEYRLTRPDGVRWVSAQGLCIRDETGRCVRFPGVSFDTTERVLAEQKLQESELHARADAQRIQSALAAGAIIGTWLWDLTTDEFTVDEAFARNFGLDPELGREGLKLAQVVESVHPDDKNGLARAIKEVIARGGAYAHQYRVRRSDGKYYWLEANGRVDHAADGTPLSFPGVLIDVESRRVMEAERDDAIAELRALTDDLERRVAQRTSELMQAEEALRQSQKMEAVGQLTGGLAHDFNNLLAGVSGALELMSVRLGQGRLAEVEKYVGVAQGATKRASALTHRLLAFSRRQTLAPRPTNVNALVRGMTELIQRTVGPSIAVSTVEAPDLWTALVDSSQLENALLNLCINARDAMPDGGRIAIETSNLEVDRVTAARLDVPEGAYLSLRVIDTGTGMSPDVIAKAFDPFFTTKPIGQGTGLGLSMIYGFAQQSGGRVRIDSVVGAGTAVSIHLPRHSGALDEQPVAVDSCAATRDAAHGSVLVVDDEPTVRLFIVDVLTDMGMTALEAGDGAAGLRILESGARVDLLVTDVGLPGGMNGRQMADAARQKRPSLNVLFVTGYAETAILDGGHLDPGMQILTKPFSVETLTARIREAMLPR